MKYEGIEESSIQEGKSIMTLFGLMVQFMTLLELIAYIILFHSIMHHDKSLVHVVQDDILKVCSISISKAFGLISNFLSDSKKEKYHHFGGPSYHIFHWNGLAYGMLYQLMIHFGGSDGFIQPAVLPIILVFSMALVTMTQIMTSPELRRYLRLKWGTLLAMYYVVKARDEFFQASSLVEPGTLRVEPSLEPYFEPSQKLF